MKRRSIPVLLSSLSFLAACSSQPAQEQPAAVPVEPETTIAETAPPVEKPLPRPSKKTAKKKKSKKSVKQTH